MAAPSREWCTYRLTTEEKLALDSMGPSLLPLVPIVDSIMRQPKTKPKACIVKVPARLRRALRKASKRTGEPMVRLLLRAIKQHSAGRSQVRYSSPGWNRRLRKQPTAKYGDDVEVGERVYNMLPNSKIAEIFEVRKDSKGRKMYMPVPSRSGPTRRATQDTLGIWWWASD